MVVRIVLWEITLAIQDFIDYLCSVGCAPAKSGDIMPGTESLLIAQERDKGNEKSLYYSLNADASFGRWYDCRTGDGDTWSAKAGERVDRDAHRKAMDAERRAYEKAKRMDQKAAAEAAAQRWALSDSPSPDHPYLVRKRISAHGIGQDGQDLLIPMRHSPSGSVIGQQAITPDGSKFFGKDVAKKGAMHVLGQIDPEGLVYVCEGYATAATVYEATETATVCAFDAGNLKPVCKALKAEFPEITIIVAGDNDQSGTGAKYGQQAALISHGHFMMPPTVGMDWNDYYIEHGIDAVIQSFAEATFPAPASATGGQSTPLDGSHPLPGGDIIHALESVAEPANDWTKDLIPKGFDQNGNMILEPRSLNNAMLLLEHLPEMVGVFRFNEFKGEIFVCKCPPWGNPATFRVRRLENIDITRAEAYLERSDGIKVGTSKILAAIEDVADRHKFHPVREYFDELKWDGVPRLATWLKKYAKCLDHDDAYTAGFGTMWLVAAVRRIRKPGAKFDTMLVFEGPENYGKSYMLRTLATFGKDIPEEYFADGIRFERIHERGSILMLQGKLIVEFAEMAGFSARDIKAVQAWITLQEDEVEVKNKQMTAVHPRQFILAGTYNPVQGNGWLANIPGQRRFIPLTVKEMIDINGLREVREQLWAEAAHLEAQGYDILVGPTSELFKLGVAERRARMVVDPWEEAIETELASRVAWKTGDIMQQIGIPVYKRNSLEHRRVCSTLDKLGWEYRQVRELNWAYGWIKKGQEQAVLPTQDAEEVKW